MTSHRLKLVSCIILCAIGMWSCKAPSAKKITKKDVIQHFEKAFFSELWKLDLDSGQVSDNYVWIDDILYNKELLRVADTSTESMQFDLYKPYEEDTTNTIKIGDINADGKDDAIIQYTVEGFTGGNLYVTYFAVFLNKDDSLVYFDRVTGGGKFSDYHLSLQEIGEDFDTRNIENLKQEKGKYIIFDRKPNPLVNSEDSLSDLPSTVKYNIVGNKLLELRE